MGNEMGNQNVTALKEEENTAVEAPEKSLQEAALADEVKGENQTVPAAENREIDEKVRELSSDDPRVDKQISDGREQGDTELKPPQTPQNPIESNDEVSQESGIKTTSSSKDAEDNEKPIESNLDENLLETSDHQKQKQPSTKTEQGDNELKPPQTPQFSIESNDEVSQESGIQITSSSKDDEDNQKPIESNFVEKMLETSDHQKQKQPSIRTETEEGDRSETTMDQKPDQNELAKVHAEPQIEEGSCWPQDKEEVLEMSMSCDDEEKGHLFETEATIVASDTDLDIEKINADLLVKEMEFEEENLVDANICEEKHEIISEVGNGLSNKTTVTLISHGDLGNKYDGELPTEMVLSRNCSSEAISESNSLNCLHEVVPEPHDKCIVLTEEAKLIGNGSEDEDEYNTNPIQFNEQAMEDLKIGKLEALQSGSLLFGPSSDSGSENEDKHEQAMNELEAMKMDASQSDLLLVGPNSDTGRENGDKYDPNPIQFSEKPMNDLADEKKDASQFDSLLVESNSDNGREDEEKDDPNPIQCYEQAMNELETEKMDPSQLDSSLVESNSDNGREDEEKDDPNPIQCYEQAMNELETEKMDASQLDSSLVELNSENGREDEEKDDPNPTQCYEQAMNELETEKMDASQLDSSLVESNSDYGREDEEKDDPNPIQCYEQAMNELETEKMDASQCGSTLVLSDHNSNGREILADSSCKPGIGDSQIKEEEAAENGYQSDFGYDKLNSASEQQLKDSEEVIELVPEIGTVPTEFTVTDYKHEEQPAENEIIHEKEEKAENSDRDGSDGEESEAIEQHASQPHPSPCPCSPLESQNHKDTVKESETDEKRTLSSRSEFSVTKASIVDCTNSTGKILVSEAELEKEQAESVAETETLVNQSTNTFESAGCGAQERMGSLSNESNPENPTIHIEPRKAPSFDFDLSLVARCEESDQTPLLHHDKIATRRFLSQECVSFGNSTMKADYGGNSLQYLAMPVEEKTIKMERNDSEKLSLLKGDEQANVVASPKKATKEPCKLPTKVVAITSSKGIGKRKLKSSIFSSCLCCAASIH